MESNSVIQVVLIFCLIFNIGFRISVFLISIYLYQAKIIFWILKMVFLMILAFLALIYYIIISNKNIIKCLLIQVYTMHTEDSEIVTSHQKHNLIS